MKKRILSLLTVLALIPGLFLPVTASADGAVENYGIIVGGVEITSENPTVDSSDASDVITSGSADYDAVTETLTLNGLTVDMTKGTTGGAAIRVCAGTYVKIILKGENNLTASAGYAGIAVEAGWDDAGNFSKEKSAQVVIKGEGTLEVHGGDSYDNPSARMAAGAGIGGDGVNLKNSDSLNGGDFGCITISGGTIKAYGGACADTYPNSSTTEKVADNYFGGGAGIGGGGIGDDSSDNWWTYAGSITITGGTVTASGGITADTTYNKTSGGAGIGTGSTGSNFSGDSEVTVTISGGTVIATGGSDGAGIGGGSNVSNSSIVITGNADVTATGGDHEDTTAYGGAGIGGGDNGFSGSIEISGEAKVKATGGGAAAGIGGGYTGIAENITITGEASVEAYGGSNTNNTRGGAGIGSGGQSYAYGDVIEGTITLNSSGKIQVVAGSGAQAVGIGTIRDDNIHSYEIYIGAAANDLWMINQDTAQPAFWGQDGTGVTNNLRVNGCTVVWYTGSAPAESGKAYAFDGTEVKQYDWTYAGSTLQLLKDGAVIMSADYPITPESSDGLGNWALILQQKKTYTVQYDWGTDNVPEGVTLPQAAEYEVGVTYTLDDTYTSESTVETDDGTYYFSGWTAQNNEDMVDGGVVKIAGYWTYVPKYTVSYDLKNGTGADGVDYSDATYDKGTEITVKAAPTRDGYTFTGWSDGTTTYQPDAKITLNGNITLTAQWRENSAPEGDVVITTGSVRLTKVDAEDTSKTLSGVAFELYGANGVKQGTYTTNASGVISVYALTPGSYYFVETRPAEGYLLDSAKHEFTVSVGNTTRLTIENRRSSVPDAFALDHYAYVIGYDDGLVHPEANITRAEVATILFRLLDEDVRQQYMTKQNSFPDVNEGDWYNTAVSTMAAMGVVNGYPDGNFHPSANITRAEFAAIAARFDDNGNTMGGSFSDIYGHWAENEICIAANNGWILGYNGLFRPNDYITRAEAMTMINRVLQRIPGSVDDLLPNMVIWPDNMDTSKWYYLAVQEATNSHDYGRHTDGSEHWSALRETPDWSALEK